MEMIFFLCLVLYCVVLSIVLDWCPYYDEDRLQEYIMERQEHSQVKVKSKRFRFKSQKLTKKQERNRDLNEDYEYRFYMAVKTISPRSINFIEETFDRYRPDSLNKSYYDNLDAIALLELVEEEARQKGTHKHIAMFIRSCAA